MPIEVFWDDDPKTILRARFVGDWTWVEYHAANERLMQMAAEVDYPFDVISDLTDSNGLPPGNLLAEIGRGHNITAPNQRSTVTVQIPKIVKTLRPIIIQITRNDNRYQADSLEEAYTIIEAVRNTNSS